MAETARLRIYDIVGGPIWVSADDGQRVFAKIVTAFEAGRAVELSFANRETIITAFLNAAIGQLYSGQYDESFLKANLNFSDLSPDDRAMVERAIDNARRYFANRAAYDQAWGEAADEDE